MSSSPLKKKEISIRRYGDRKFYQHGKAKYIKLEEIAELVRQGHDVTIIDSKSKQDITGKVLLHVLFSCLTSVSAQELIQIIKNYGTLGKFLACNANSKL